MNEKQLKKLIEASGMSQRQVAIAVGCDPSHVTHMVNGDTPIKKYMELAIKKVIEDKSNEEN